jgi:acyl-homoserine-lactone acylase
MASRSSQTEILWDDFGVPHVYAENLQEMEYREYLDAFVSGMNDYATALSDEIDEKLKGVLPITSVDVIAHVLRIMYLEFVAGEDVSAASMADQ